jgi:Leucine-rich repeat (LRR) protein
MGTVYLAEDVRLGRKAAVKIMKAEVAARPENRTRFLREARAAAAVEHDNIVPIWQVGESADGCPFIAMPSLQGEMLDSRLKREPVQPLGVILKVARELADGLAAAHARGLIHRDIKPANVWIEGDPESKDLTQQVRRSKILDFGLARSQAGEDVQLTGEGAILGTLTYMSPEQASGEKVGPLADLFSLGVLLYRMATGRLPFGGPNSVAVLNALATVTPPPARSLNRNLPQSLSDLIGRLMSKDPAGRPQSAAETAAAIRQIVKEVQARKSAPTAATQLDARPSQVPPAPAVRVDPEPTVSEPTQLDPPAVEVAPRREVRRGRRALLIALGLLALVPLGWWLATVILRVETPSGTLIVEIDDAETQARIKDGKLILTGPDDKVRYTLSPSERNRTIEAGQYRIHVEGADGLAVDTPEFTLKKDGKVVVRVTLDPRTVAKSLDPDRKAAEYVLSIGGVVRVNGQATEIKAAADLPREEFRLTQVLLNENRQVSDAGLACFKDCENLLHLYLSGTRVGDAGLAHFKNCKNFSHLFLGGTQVSDAGLASFKDCKNLGHLDLNDTRVSDAGLVHLKDWKGPAHLILNNTQVSDAGLVHLKDYRGVLVLGLMNTQIGDGGLAHVTDCKTLREVDLRGTKVTNAGLAHLLGWKDLTIVRLQKTQVTKEKLEELHKSLPGCRIEWDGGVIQPTISPDRRAAEYVLSIGGGVWINDEGREFRGKVDLPGEHFRLTRFDLEKSPRVTDGGLAAFKDCKNLKKIVLTATNVSDAGLAHFKDSKQLRELTLAHTKVMGVGLAAFAGCRELTFLDLRVTGVGDAGVAHFKDCKDLVYVDLRETRVTDDGLACFKNCRDLTKLYLKATQTNGPGLVHIKDSKNLKELELTATNLADDSVALLKEHKNLTSLWLGRTQVADDGLAHVRDLKNLIELDLGKTKVTDDGLRHLTNLQNLKVLWLDETPVTNNALVHLKMLTNLRDLHLTKTKVTPASIDDVKKALPKCRIVWDRGVIEPTEK